MPYITEYFQGYERIGVGMFKDPFPRGIFLLRAPDTINVSPINMIFSSNSASLRSFDPWVVPHVEDVDYGSTIPLTVVNITNPPIPSSSVDTYEKLHPHVECDQPYPPLSVVDSLSSHDFIDTMFPS